MARTDGNSNRIPQNTQVLQYGAIIVIVPFVIALLLAWTIVGRLCSLRPGVILWMVTALVAIPFLVDFDVVNPAGGAGDDPDYAFETNLLGEKQNAS